jgi:hypothetical protein
MAFDISKVRGEMGAPQVKIITLKGSNNTNHDS